jgi:hypothetical protein
VSIMAKKDWGFRILGHNFGKSYDPTYETDEDFQAGIGTPTYDRFGILIHSPSYENIFNSRIPDDEGIKSLKEAIESRRDFIEDALSKGCYVHVEDAKTGKAKHIWPGDEF